MLRQFGSYVLCTLVTCVPLAGCAGSALAPATAPLGAAATARSTGPRAPGVPSASQVQHVVFVIQENRSFDNMFMGYPNADTRTFGLDSSGARIPLQPIPLEAPYDLDHSLKAFLESYDGGKMDGFNLEASYGAKPPPNPQYGYVPASESKPLFDIAKQYVLADHMFTSQLDDSFVSHQYAIAAQAQSSVDLPSGVWGCSGGPDDTIETLTAQRTYGPTQTACFDYTTLGDELDAAGLGWAYYAQTTEYAWSAYQAVRHIRDGPDWQNVVAPSADFVTDVSTHLAPVTWITPGAFDSDHAGSGGSGGPDWVSSVVNAIGESPFWNTTTVFVMWDDWGGWYDHVKPPYLDYDGAGIRVPLMVISPYAKKGYVSHVRYETGSVLKYIEDAFGLPRMAASDRRAASPAGDCFDYNQRPRAFVRFKTLRRPSDFANEPPGFEPIDSD